MMFHAMRTISGIGIKLPLKMGHNILRSHKDAIQFSRNVIMKVEKNFLLP